VFTRERTSDQDGTSDWCNLTMLYTMLYYVLCTIYYVILYTYLLCYGVCVGYPTEPGLLGEVCNLLAGVVFAPTETGEDVAVPQRDTREPGPGPKPAEPPIGGHVTGGTTREGTRTWDSGIRPATISTGKGQLF
jgi:hypothetical protein